MTTMLTWLGVLVAGGVGAVARFYLDRFVSGRTPGSFPSGTLAVNISGATILGFLAGLSLPPAAALVIGTGIIGSYTTFSTWMLESQRLAEERQGRLALYNLVGSSVLGIVAAGIGQFVGEQL